MKKAPALRKGEQSVPYFDNFNEGEMQFARAADGSSYYIPSDMPYKDWKRRFVVGLGENKTLKPITEITDDTISKVPRVTPATYSSEMYDLIQQEHKNLLRASMTQNNHKEVAFIFNSDFSNKISVLGTEDNLNFPQIYGKDNKD